ncbi:hypothetical protein MASR2M8_02520 [Opitutaceae bacterium]
MSLLLYDHLGGVFPVDDSAQEAHEILPNVTDETRAGERGVSPFEPLKMLSGEGTCDLGHIPRVVLWRSGWALSSSRKPSNKRSDCNQSDGINYVGDPLWGMGQNQNHKGGEADESAYDEK